MKKIFLLIFLLSIIFSQTDRAELRLLKIFSSNMILQRNISIPIWGWAKENSSVTIEFNGNKISAGTNGTGEWKVYLPTCNAGGPFEMVIMEVLNENEISRVTFHNIMIGDVWFASGQSNMEWKVSQSMNAKSEIKNACYPNVRFFQVPHAIENEPRQDVKSGEWKLCDSTSVKEFSAAAYFFARQLHQEQNVPIGIIQATWGGTPVEAWTSKEMLMSYPETKKIVLQNVAASLNKTAFDKDISNEKIFWEIAYNSMNGLNLGFIKNDFDDSSWKKIDMPNVFRDVEKPFYEGVDWLRKYVEIPASMIGKDLRLSLGFPEMMYYMYFNEKTICEKVWNAEKKHVYKIPAGVVKQGKNVLALRLAELWGGGGLNPPADSLYITDSKTKIPLTGEWRYVRNAEPAIPKIMNYHKYPTFLFNGMINPVASYGIKGFIWYQGEDNVDNPYQYRTLFPMMINDLRIRWQQGNLPFIYVQLANYLKRSKEPSESKWAELREAQTMTLAYPNTGMATIIDIGEADNIHPLNKQEISYRLSLAANKIAYDKELVYSGPMFRSMKIDGDAIRIKFDHIGSGLIIKGKENLTGFAVAGEDKKFYWADAVINGDEVIVKSAKVSKPSAVRYAWADNPECNLYNKENLPTVPFRTDEW